MSSRFRCIACGVMLLGVCSWAFAASGGLVEAQYHLSVMYSSGIGTPRNVKEAARWCLKAAEGGDPSARFDYGVMCMNSQGVSRDYQAGVKWFLSAAALGNVDAMNCLSLCYRLGMGVDRSPQTADVWLRRAQKQQTASSSAALACSE